MSLISSTKTKGKELSIIKISSQDSEIKQLLIFHITEPETSLELGLLDSTPTTPPLHDDQIHQNIPPHRRLESADERRITHPVIGDILELVAKHVRGQT